MRKPWKIAILLAFIFLFGGGIWYLSAQLSPAIPEEFVWEEEEQIEVPFTEDPSSPNSTSDSNAAERTAVREAQLGEAVSVDESIPTLTHMDQTGSIAMFANGKKIGEEDYEFVQQANGNIRLRSTGLFVFRIVLVDTKFHFQQEMIWNAELKPNSASFKVRGPLGVGNRDMNMKFMGEDPFRSTVITVGDKKNQVELPDGILALQGTFSSYVILPYLLLGQERVEVEMIFAGGFGGGEERRNPDNPGASHTEIEFVRQQAASIQSGDVVYEMEQYLMRQVPRDSEETGGLHLLFLENQFAGAFAASQDSEDELFLIYRTDLFEDGFEFVELN